MDVRHMTSEMKYDKFSAQVTRRTRLRVWFVRICFCILIWTLLVQLVTVGGLWHPNMLIRSSSRRNKYNMLSIEEKAVQSPPSLPPARNYSSNGYLKVSCNGGLNQMRAAICDMVTVARLLNVTLIVPELDKTSFWADHSNFEDVFDVRHFIDSLRDEVRIVKRLPKKFVKIYGYQPLEMAPVSWSNEKYYLQQILPLFEKHKLIHFKKTDARLANNMIPLDLQKLRCRVNFQALRFTPQIEDLGHKLVHILRGKGPFMVLHLRYEMDMLAFSGCTHGCTKEEADKLKRLRYAFPRWREKDIVSEERRLQGQCPLTPEEASLVLLALDFNKETQIYIASGEIYGSERRLDQLRASFPHIVKKEMLLDHEDLQQFQNHSSQMAALDFIVSVSSSVFVPTYDGNMAKIVEGHRRYLGFRKTLQLNRRKIVELIDLHKNNTLSWDEFSAALKSTHKKKVGEPSHRKVMRSKPKEEDYFYANPHECLCEKPRCNNLSHTENVSGDYLSAILPGWY
ncbi:hypothetical protein ACET3Z_029372 [Daucus carota]